jgi:exodeoxyribonuclease VII large subunit
LRAQVEGTGWFSGLWVRGEISTYKLHHASGHRYFTLREGTTSIRAVLFASYGRQLAFEPQVGMDVWVRCDVTVYERDASAELLVREMLPAGVGAQYLALQALRQKLEQEGLFDPARKRPLPTFPRRVGVVTSLSGAALRDVVAVMRRRLPGVDIWVAPAQVQGEAAPGEIVAALTRLGEAGVDVIIVGRGGGAREDLSAFNCEEVVRAVAACPVPVISAVGHQTDWTLTDFAADQRAPTPSAAAEMAVPDGRVLAQRVSQAQLRLRRALAQRHRREAQRLRALLLSGALSRPQRRVERAQMRLAGAQRGLEAAMARAVERGKERLGSLAQRLEALSPLAVLRRGYAVLLQDHAKPLPSAGAARVGQALTARLWDGELGVVVTRVGFGGAAGGRPPAARRDGRQKELPLGVDEA